MLIGVSQLKSLRILKVSMPFLALEDPDAELLGSLASQTVAGCFILVLKKNKITKNGAKSIAKGLAGNKKLTQIKLNISS